MLRDTSVRAARRLRLAERRVTRGPLRRPRAAVSVSLRQPTESEVRFEVKIGGRTRTVRVASPGGRLEPTGDAALALGLVPAMARGSGLEVAGEVSPRLLAALPQIQGTLARWFPGLAVVPVEATPAASAALPPPVPGRGSFFSGGIDSLHNAFTLQDRLTHLVFVHGFDFSLRSTARRQRAARAAHDVADTLGLSVLEIETDARTFADRLFDWRAAHGAVLAAIALLLQHRLGEIFIASSHDPDNQDPWGTHGDLDPLWSTERMRFVHHGDDVDRFDKLDGLLDRDVALRTLRVCSQWAGDAYNCGTCPKCLVTTLYLELVGALDRCPVLPDRVDRRRIAAMRIDYYNLFLGDVLLAKSRANGVDPELARAVETCMAESRRALGRE